MNGITLDSPIILIKEKTVYLAGKTEKQVKEILDAEIVFHEQLLQ